jgi:hypothetical protein
VARTRPPCCTTTSPSRTRHLRRRAGGDRPPAAPGSPGLRAPGRAARLRPQGQHARLPRLPSRLPGPGRIPRLPRLVVQNITRELRGLDRSSPPPTRLEPVYGVARSVEGHREGLRRYAGDPPRGPYLQTEPRRRYRATHRRTPSEHDHDLELSRSSHRSTIEIGDHVVTAHMAPAGLKKEAKESRRGGQYLTIQILHNDMMSWSRVRTPARPACGASSMRDRREGARRALGRPLRDAQELEPALQAQPRQDQDGRHLRAAEVVRNLALREQDKGLSTARSRCSPAPRRSSPPS